MRTSKFDFLDCGRGYDEDKVPYNQIMEDQIVDQLGYIKRNVEELNLMIAEYYASNWRDDDCPIAEKTLGTKRSLFTIVA